MSNTHFWTRSGLDQYVEQPHKPVQLWNNLSRKWWLLRHRSKQCWTVNQDVLNGHWTDVEPALIPALNRWKKLWAIKKGIHMLQEPALQLNPQSHYHLKQPSPWSYQIPWAFQSREAYLYFGLGTFLRVFVSSVWEFELNVWAGWAFREDRRVGFAKVAVGCSCLDNGPFC